MSQAGRSRRGRDIGRFVRDIVTACGWKLPGTTRTVAMQQAQNRAVVTADEAGRRGDTLQYAVLLAALAHTLSMAGPAPAAMRRAVAVLLAPAAAMVAGAGAF